MASVRVYRATAPYSVGLTGALAGVAAVASTTPAATVAAELLAEEGIAVHVEGVRGSLARAAEEAARRLLEKLGEEAQLRLIVSIEAPGTLLLPEAHVAAAAAKAVAEMLGLDPDPLDAAETLVQATALTAGRPLAPVAAAAYTAATVVASEQPPYYTTVQPPPTRLYIIPPCRGLTEPPVAVEATRHLQLAQAAAALAAAAARGDWGPTRLWQLLDQDSPWDYAAPIELREARHRARTEGAYAAGVEPYSLALVVAAPSPAPAEAAKAKLEAVWGCRPQLIELQPRQPAEENR